MNIPVDIDKRFSEQLEGPLKRTVLFHDLSGFGKCSITAALPIFSAAGIEGVCAPTAVLSTHTGGFEGYTFRDLTEDLPAMLGHWNDLDIHLDSLYSGYLGSPEQARILKDFVAVQQQKNPEFRVYVDPVMADYGKLYPGFDQEMVENMKQLVPIADILFPNITEATLLLDEPYKEGPYDEAYIEEIAKKLTDMGAKKVVLTGLDVGEGKLGIAVYEDGNFQMTTIPEIEGAYHGTGDVFASFFISAVENGLSLIDAADLAAYLTYGAIKRTQIRQTPRRDGVDYEGVLPELIKQLEL